MLIYTCTSKTIYEAVKYRKHKKIWWERYDSNKYTSSHTSPKRLPIGGYSGNNKTPFTRSCRILPSKIAPTSARRESAVTIDSDRDADDDAAEPETKDQWSMRDGG